MSNYTKNSLQIIWNQTLEKLNAGAFFDASIFNTYIIESKLYDINQNNAIVIVPNFVSRNVFESNKVIERILDEVEQFSSDQTDDQTLILIQYK